MVTTPAARVDPAQLLRQARHDLASSLDSQTAAPQSVLSQTPIRALADDVGAVVVARARYGLTPAGTEFPRQPLLTRVALPSVVLAALDLVLLIVAIARGDSSPACVSALLLVIFAGASIAAARYAAADPLRLGPEQRLEIENAGHWTPSHGWSGPSRERNLVAAAARAAQRIVDSAAWRYGVLARGGVVLSLATELDLVETQALDSNDADWSRLLTRVAALLAYAAVVESIAADDATVVPDQADVEALAFFLSGAIYDVG